MLRSSIYFQISSNYLKRLQITNKTNNSSSSTNSSSNNAPLSNRRYPAITHSTIELEMNRNTFLEGKVRLSCVATVFNLYRKEKETILEEERPRPRPSSVLGTRDATAGRSKKFECSLGACLLTLFGWKSFLSLFDFMLHAYELLYTYQGDLQARKECALKVITVYFLLENIFLSCQVSSLIVAFPNVIGPQQFV